MKLIFLFLGLSLDILTKIGAILWIPPMTKGFYPFGGIGIFQRFFGISFSLNYVENTGAAYGMFPGHPGILFAIRAIIIATLAIYLGANWKKRGTFPLWLVLTGAIGNAIDFLMYGHVVDFIHFNFWGYSFPVFNFADSYITIGVVFLLLFEFFKKSYENLHSRN